MTITVSRIKTIEDRMKEVADVQGVRGLLKYFSDLGLFVFQEREDKIFVSYFVHNKRTDSLDTETTYFIGSTAAEIMEAFVQWYQSLNNWIGKGKRLVLNLFDNPMDFSLREALNEFGFKSVSIQYENTNFVQVSVTYCYVKEPTSTKVNLDGRNMFIVHGDKFKTFNSIKEWVEKNPDIRPTYNREMY